MNDPSKMDEKHVALLRRHRETFVKSVEVERLIPKLENIITPAEVEEMNGLPSSQDRVQRLLDILPMKGKAAFTYFCLALEGTYPHLLTVMCIGRDREPAGSSPSTLSPYTSESDIEERYPRILLPRPVSRSGPRTISSGKGSSAPNSIDSDPEELINRSLPDNRGIPLMDNRGIPFPDTRGIPLIDNRVFSLPENRGMPQTDYGKLKEKCHDAMIQLETLSQENAEILKKCDMARKDADLYCKQYRSAMTNGDQLRGELQALQQEYAELMTERNQVQQEINDLRQRHESDANELKELKKQSMMGYPDVKRMYEMAMDRYETLKHEYDSLQKRFSELKGSQSANLKKADKYQEENSRLQLQIDVIKKELNTLRQQYSSAIGEFEMGKREQEDLRQQEFNVRQELHFVKSAIKKAQVEKENAVREHRLVMSERDVVHKEIEKLQDEAQMEAAKRKSAEEKCAAMQSDCSKLQQKLVDTIREHDHAVLRSGELSERCRNMISNTISNTMMAKKERDRILQELHKYEEELQVARHERKEALSQLEEVVQEQYKAKQEQEMTNNEYKEVNKELESLRRKVETLTREHKDAVQESENAKRLRDWAFTERDKIVAERESIRVLCDKLRRERDRAVSNYAEALRKTDDVERKRNEVTKELNEVKQNVKQQEEKEARMQQLIVHHSKDSAIDADSQEWQVEKVALETDLDDDGDVSMLGFDIGECNKDLQFPEDCSVVITKVDKGSIADGRLRVNDCVVRVNNVDLTNGDRSSALQAVKNSRGLLNMVVKRRRSSGMRHHAVKLFCGGKEHGLVLDSGVFISRIVPGSAAAKEGSLLPGDRILYVDGYLVEDKSVSEVEKLLATNCESLMLSVVRVLGMSMSSSTSPTGDSLQSHDETSSSKSSLTMGTYLAGADIQEQKPDRNGNSQQQQQQQSCKNMVKKALREYVQDTQQRESRHSRESSWESCSANNSGDCTPLALSRENSLREHVHVLEAKRVSVADYPQGSLKRGEMQNRDSRQGFHGPVFEHPHQALPQDNGCRESLPRDVRSHGQELTNGNVRPTHENQSNENSYPRDMGMDTHDLPSPFVRGGLNRDSRRSKHSEWIDSSRRSYLVWGPSHGSNARSGISKGRESSNASLNNRLLNAPSHNGNVQQQRPRSQECYQNPPESIVYVTQSSFDNTIQQRPQPGHIRSLSSSSGREIREGYGPQDQMRKGNNDREHSVYADWAPTKEHSDKVTNGIHESRTAPVKTNKQSSPVVVHSTWPRGHPDTWSDNRKKRKREPLPMSGQNNENSFWSEPKEKPKPPSRTSSFKTNLRHGIPSSSSSSSSDSRRQPSFAGSEGKSQGSLNSPKSPSVTVSPVSPSSFQNRSRTYSRKQNAQDTTQQNGFHEEAKQQYVKFPSAPTSMFRPVSGPMISDVRSQVSPVSESAIVPQVDYPVHGRIASARNRSREPLQLVRAVPATTWESGSISSESSTTNHHSNPLQGPFYPAGPTPAQVIVQPNVVPWYKATSYTLPPVDFNRQDGPNFPDGPFLSEESVFARASLPEQRSRNRGSSQSCSSEHQLDYFKHHLTAEARTNSLPLKCDRIRLDTGPSVGSSDIVSVHSGHSSPTSPSILDDSPGLSPTGSFEPIINVTEGTGPNDPRYIKIERMLEPGLGFCIKEGMHGGTQGGIFVNSVTERSLADRAGLKYGDQILEFNGINLRQATYENAVIILRSAGNTVSIKAQYNRNKIGDHQRDSMCSSTQSTPIASQTSTRTNSPTPTVTPPTPRAHRTHSIVSSISSMMGCDASQPRFVFLQKSGGSLGIGLYGGNRVGIFVSDIEPTSVAAQPGKLEVGDQILECNGVDLRSATAEQAANELHKPADELTLLVQQNISKFNKIQNHHCDELFLRALVDFTADKEGQLDFKRDDVLYVDNTMYNGSLGVWNAWLVDTEGHKTKTGQILSKNRLHREMVHRRQRSESMQEEELRTASSRRSSGPARRSFLKRKKKHQHNNSKDSRELSEGSITDVPVQEDASVPTYLRVERLDMHLKRPVVLLGPLSDKVAMEMEEGNRDKYTRGHRRMVQSSHQALENDLENGLIVDYQRKDNMYEVINTSTVKDICKRGFHCVLYNISAKIADRLQRLQLHPIVIFIKFKSVKSIKEQKDPRFLREKITNKQAKEMFEIAGRIEQEFRSIFTETIQGSSLALISEKVKKAIDHEQRKPIWIPSTQPL